jgi:hypothetical protein
MLLSTKRGQIRAISPVPGIMGTRCRPAPVAAAGRTQRAKKIARYLKSHSEELPGAVDVRPILNRPTLPKPGAGSGRRP